MKTTLTRSASVPSILGETGKRSHGEVGSQAETSSEVSDPSLPKFKKFRGAPSMVEQWTQTVHPDDLRANTLANVGDLFKGIDNQIAIGEKQKQKLAKEFERISSVTSPAGAEATDCVCLPPDVMAYKVEGGNGAPELAYNCPEMNGTGFGGIRDLPIGQLAKIMDAFANAAAQIKETCHTNGEHPLIIVANSGREGVERKEGAYPISANSKMIWEKAFIADRCAERLGNPIDPCYADSLDKIVVPYFKKIDAAKSRFDSKFLDKNGYDAALAEAYSDATQSMKNANHRPSVLLGYSRDVAECCRIEDGRPYLFGRPVNGLVNDRAALNLSKKEGKPLDYKKFSLINVTVDEGVNKVAAALARNEFHSSDEAKALPELARNRGFTYDVGGMDRTYHFKKGAGEDPAVSAMTDAERANHRLTYFRGIEENEGLEGVRDAVDDFLALGLKPLFKPNGTGQSKGIIGYKTDESKEEFRKRFEENIKSLEKDFGKGAGYPFLVMPLLKLAETPNGEMYDLRFTTYQKIDASGKGTLHSIPLILKKEPKKTEQEKQLQAGEFSPTNVTAAVAKTGRPGTDFIVPLCTDEGLRQSGLTKDQAKSISLYFSSFQSWLLKTKYPRT